MSTNWPSAIISSGSSRSLNSGMNLETSLDLPSPCDDHTDFIKTETEDLTQKVKHLQNAYSEYLDAQQEVVSSLQRQSNEVSNGDCFKRVNEIITDMEKYSKKMELILQRMDNIFDRVEKLQNISMEMKQIVETVPPGKPVPAAGKQIQSSMDTMMNKAKNSLETTINSAKNGDMKDKISDSMSTFGEKMSSVMDKAKNTVQSFTM